MHFTVFVCVIGLTVIVTVAGVVVGDKIVVVVKVEPIIVVCAWLNGERKFIVLVEVAVVIPVVNAWLIYQKNMGISCGCNCDCWYVIDK